MIADERSARAFVAQRCDAAAMQRLDHFAAMLKAENQRQNLVSGRTLDIIWQRHIADSVQLLDFVPRETSTGANRWLDLGTGAGLPGMVIAISRPHWDVVMVESRRMRVAFLEEVKAELGLTSASIRGTRLELVQSFEANVISARAFAPLPKLLDLSSRFSTSGTCWLLPKGRSAAHELKQLPGEWRKMFHVEPSQTDPDAGIIVGTPPEQAK